MKINYSDEKVIKGKKSIFLAGPTTRSKDLPSWRIQACELLEQLGFDGVVYYPEYSTKEPKWDYVDQAMWEREALNEATVIMFWVPRDLPKNVGLTTNVEFGYWIKSGKVIYGRPGNAEKIKYLDWLYEVEWNEKPIDNLYILLEKTIEKANNTYKGD